MGTDKRVLIVVDWQNDFVNGALGFKGADKADKGISELVFDYFKDQNSIVIFTFDTHFDDTYMASQEGKKLPVPHCIRGTEGWKLFGETGKLAYRANEKTSLAGDSMVNLGMDVVIGKWADGNNVQKMYTNTPADVYFVEKPTFPSSNLGELLKIISNKETISDITLCGLVTNMCVMGNAVVAKAACPEAEIIIKKDLVNSFDKELHQKALDVMASMQMTIE